MSLNFIIKRKAMSYNTAKYNYTVVERIDHLKIFSIPRDFVLSRHYSLSPHFVYIGPECAIMV